MDKTKLKLRVNSIVSIHFDVVLKQPDKYFALSSIIYLDTNVFNIVMSIGWTSGGYGELF